jgi:hypothetical protein
MSAPLSKKTASAQIEGRLFANPTLEDNMKIAIAQTIEPTARIRRSSDSVWPLRRADGQTYAATQPHYQPKVTKP